MISYEDEPGRRFGNRAEIEQPGTLTIDGRAATGVIQNVGLRGAFFATGNLPAPGTRGVLTRHGGRGVNVQVVWQKQGPQPGVGLRFDS